MSIASFVEPQEEVIWCSAPFAFWIFKLLPLFVYLTPEYLMDPWAPVSSPWFIDLSLRMTGLDKHIVLVINDCMTNYPKTWWSETTSLYYLTVSEDQEFGSGLVWCFWLLASLEVVVNSLTEAALFEALTGPWENTRALGFWLEASVPCQNYLSTRLPECPQNKAVGFPWVSIQESPPRQKPQSFQNLILEMTHLHFSGVMFTRSQSLNPACLLSRTGELYSASWRQMYQRIDGHIFKTTKCRYLRSYFRQAVLLTSGLNSIYWDI